jgi:hypothetical protein
MARTALLISQQSLYPHAGCKWVQAATDAVRWCRDYNHTVVTSVGVPTRNLVTALCAIENVSCELVLPITNQVTIDEILTDYGLSQVTKIIAIGNSSIEATKEETFHSIDSAILELADIVIPVSIRKGGQMQLSCETAERDGKTINRDFEIQHWATASPVGYKLDTELLSEEISKFSDPFLIHWTRTSNGPWPNERSVDFYREITSSQQYPRTAVDTLCRILATKTLCASSRHIAADEPVVSFSSLPPLDVIPLIRWRARYRQMSFEPYGVGIRKSVALTSGILPVKYGEPTVSDSGDAWLTQSIGKRTDWRQECEYRHRGELLLNEIAAGDICIFTRTEAETREVTNRFGLRSIWFER